MNTLAMTHMLGGFPVPSEGSTDTQRQKWSFLSPGCAWGSCSLSLQVSLPFPSQAGLLLHALHHPARIWHVPRSPLHGWSPAGTLPCHPAQGSLCFSLHPGGSSGYWSKEKTLLLVPYGLNRQLISAI